MLNKKGQQKRARELVESRLAVGAAAPDILRSLEEQGLAPARSTLYAWVRQWRDARALDTSGAWTLATDETGRPDIVMRVLAALEGTRMWREDTDQHITHTDARWLVRLATAFPDWLQRESTAINPVELDLYGAAVRYNSLVATGNTAAIQRMDAMLALIHVDDSRFLRAQHDAIQRHIKEG